MSESNRRIVSSLYRQSLRLSKSWINRRDLYRTKALEIRAQFEANKGVKDPRQIHHLLVNTKALLEKYAHPDPIIPPQRPGGTKFDRNVFPPQEERKYNTHAQSKSKSKAKQVKKTKCTNKNQLSKKTTKQELLNPLFLHATISISLYLSL